MFGLADAARCARFHGGAPKSRAEGSYSQPLLYSHMPSDIVSFAVPGLKLNFAHSSRCRATSSPREERQLLIVA